MNFSTTVYAGAGLDNEPIAKGLSLQGTQPAASRGLIYLRALAGGLPGSWQADHRKESETFVGWNGVAIHQKCLQLMQADCAVYRDVSATAKRKRRMKVYTTQDETEEVPETHPLLKLLKRPNPWQSGSIFRYSLCQQLSLTGRAMIWNVPNKSAGFGVNTGNGKTAMRIVIPTAFASPVHPSSDLPMGGWRIQPNSTFWGNDPEGFVEMFGGAHLAYGKVVPTEQMQTISWPHPLFTEDGCSPSGRGSRWIDGETQVGIAQWAQLKNGADPSIHIEIPEDAQWDDEIAERYAAKFREKYGGPQNAGSVLMTQGGAVSNLSMTPTEMAYTEAFTQYRDAVMALHGAVPMDADTYAGFFAKVKQFTELVIQPELDMIAESDTERLAKDYDGQGTLTIEYTAKSIDDPEVTDRETTTLVAARVYKVDEVRTKYGLPPLGGEEGEAFAGQAPQQMGMNVNGALSLNGQQPGGFGLSLGNADSSGATGMPSLSLGSAGQDALPPRLSLNGVGKQHTNGHAKAWRGYP